ncbi:MAG: 6-carboxytetrahydropterin synthase [Variibacter sp.]|nr:6-carboxytetrahydropterin synthase [Variibacter sp.]
MIETFKEFTFEAKRSLPPHESLQSHVFRVRLVFRGNPDPVYGWPINHNDVDVHFQELLALVNRKHLNEIEGLSLPSTENLALWIWEHLSGALPLLVRITVSKGTPGQGEGCTYSGRS